MHIEIGKSENRKELAIIEQRRIETKWQTFEEMSTEEKHEAISRNSTFYICKVSEQRNNMDVHKSFSNFLAFNRGLISAGPNYGKCQLVLQSAGTPASHIPSASTDSLKNIAINRLALPDLSNLRQRMTCWLKSADKCSEEDTSTGWTAATTFFNHPFRLSTRFL